MRIIDPTASSQLSFSRDCWKYFGPFFDFNLHLYNQKSSDMYTAHIDFNFTDLKNRTFNICCLKKHCTYSWEPQLYEGWAAVGVSPLSFPPTSCWTVSRWRTVAPALRSTKWLTQTSSRSVNLLALPSGGRTHLLLSAHHWPGAPACRRNITFLEERS